MKTCRRGHHYPAARAQCPQCKRAYDHRRRGGAVQHTPQQEKPSPITRPGPEPPSDSPEWASWKRAERRYFFASIGVRDHDRKFREIPTGDRVEPLDRVLSRFAILLEGMVQKVDHQRGLLIPHVGSVAEESAEYVESIERSLRTLKRFVSKIKKRSQSHGNDNESRQVR